MGGTATIWSQNTTTPIEKYVATVVNPSGSPTEESKVTENMSKTSDSQTRRISRLRSVAPVPTSECLGELVSDLYLVLTQTVSARVWSIAQWRSGYVKVQPWRNIVNHPVPGDVIAIYELPSKEYHERRKGEAPIRFHATDA